MPDLRWLTSVFTPEAHWGLVNTFRAKDAIVYLPPTEDILLVSLSRVHTHTILTAVDSLLSIQSPVHLGRFSFSFYSSGLMVKLTPTSRTSQ